MAGLLGLLGVYGLVRFHQRNDARRDEPVEDVFARYPLARGPALPNADAAHTPLMTPAITPAALADQAPLQTPLPDQDRPPRPARPAAEPQALTRPGPVAAHARPPIASPVPTAHAAPIHEAAPVTSPSTDNPEPRTDAVVPRQRPAETGAIAGELTMDPDPAQVSDDQDHEPPIPAEPAIPKQKRFHPRNLIDPVIGKAKAVLRRG
ncbi:hypothetical protein [Amycolatopsis sp. NPDC051071]|uniref:hypothetical protein n=1 Tax=Amycolatopsis sp. NPDC051071 TaxID=3154637 RepID=UPI00343BABBA